MARSSARSERGSAFVDAVLAAGIVAITLSATFQVIADGAGRQRAADLRRSALLVAQSEMDAVGAEIPLQAGAQDGVSGDFVWRVEISPYAEDSDANAVGPVWRVAVGVRRRGESAALVTLDSLRLGRNA